LLKRKQQHTNQGMLTPAQLRAARALVGYTREQLAEASGTSAETIKRFEQRKEGSDPRRSTMVKWRTALAQAGVAFIEADNGQGEGVRFKNVRGRKP
jgi:transcriptional regulator with XRE-family HTH domain